MVGSGSCYMVGAYSVIQRASIPASKVRIFNDDLTNTAKAHVTCSEVPLVTHSYNFIDAALLGLQPEMDGWVFGVLVCSGDLSGVGLNTAVSTRLFYCYSN